MRAKFPRGPSGAAALALTLSPFWSGQGAAEEVKLRVVYPAPRAEYRRLSTSDQTHLARDRGNVQIGGPGSLGIGTTSPSFKLEVAGNIKCSFGFLGYGPSPALSFQDGVSATKDWDVRVESGRLKFSDQFTMLPGGYAGLGTAAPAYPLQVSGDGSATRLCINGDCRSAWPSGEGGLWSVSGSNLFYNKGNVGVGQRAPAYKFDLLSEDGNDGLLAETQNGGMSRSAIVLASNAAGSRRFGIWADGGNFYIGRFLPSGLYWDFMIASNYNHSSRSSLRYKRRIRPLGRDWEKALSLQGVRFDWAESGEASIGLIAEEVGKLFPELVEFEANGTDASGLEYRKLTAVLVEALKDQQQRLENQQRDLEALSREVDQWMKEHRRP